MTHSYAETLTLTCANCGRDFDAQFWLIVDTVERPDLLERIRAGTLHDLACPHCGDPGHMDAPLLLFRPDDDPAILFSPAEETTAEEDREQARQLVEMLQTALGDQWQDDWLAAGLRSAPRTLLPAVLNDDPENAMAQMAEQAAAELARLQGEDPARFAELQAAMDSMVKEAAPLVPLIEQFIRAETWDASRRIVEQHPELLSDEADRLLDTLIASARMQNDDRAVQMFEEHRYLLRRCQEAGVARAFAEKVLPPEALAEAESAGLTPEETLAMAEAANQIPPELREILAELAASGVEINSPEGLKAALASRPDLAARLEAAAQAMGTGGMDVPPLFRDDLQQTQEAEQRYLRTGDRSALDAAAVSWERVLGHSTFPSSDERFQLAVMNNAGRVFLRRYWSAGRLADLNRALELWQTAVQRTPPDSPDLPSRLNNLGTGLSDRYGRTGALADLEEAIRVYQTAVGRTPPDSPDLPGYLNNLGNGLSDRYGRTGALADLEEAIRVYQTAVQRTPPDSPDLPSRLNNLGTGLSDRYGRTGALADLEEAIRVYQTAVQRTPPDSPDLPSRLNNLGTGLSDRYGRTGALADLEEAIRVYQTAVQRTPPDSPDLPSRLNNLGTGLSDRYGRTGALADMEEAIRVYQTAVQRTPPDSPDLPSRLNNLGTGLRDRYGRTGALADLEEAIRVYQTAVQRTPPDSPDLPSRLNNLGTGLSDRYGRTGALADLEEAIRVYQTAVQRTPPDSPDLPSRLNNLGNGLSARYGRTGALADLEEAIRVYQTAVQRTPPDSPDLPSLLNNLGTGLSDRYGRTGALADLEEAIRVYQTAVQRTPPDSPDLPSRLNNLGTGLSDRYGRTGALADLEEAIRVYQTAVQRTPPDSPDLPGYLNNLGNGLRDRYGRTGALADLEEARDSYARACSRGIDVALEESVRSARNWGNWALERREWAEATEAYDYSRRAIDLLFATQTNRAAKESWLKEAQGLPANAAYALARLDRPEEAVVTLEAGRARLLAEALEATRRDLEQLEPLGHKDLLERYRAASVQVTALQQAGQQTSSSSDGPTTRPDFTTLRRQMEDARNELNATIAAIRQIPGYEDFFLPPSFEKIQRAATPDAPLVYLLTTSAGSLALLVRAAAQKSDFSEKSDFSSPPPVAAVWLDDLDETKLREALVGPAEGSELGGYLGAYDRWRRNPRDKDASDRWFAALDQTTRWLWDALMGPVLSHLAPSPAGEGWGEGKAPSPVGEGWGEGESPTPHATLIPTGLLSLLPLHAAWTEDAAAPTGRRYALDAITVSYAASARALADAHETAARIAGDGLLAVDNPDGSLVFSRQEVAAARAYFPANNTVILAGNTATRQNVIDQFLNHPIYHFSTHGWAGWSEPLAGGLLMAGDAPLTLADILDMRLRGARLAVLSACETGIPGTKLPDEVVSLPTGFAQAGVAGVVASLWSVNDMSTAMLMERFYRGWREGGLSPAEALRRAQIWLRDATNREMITYFEQDVPSTLPQRMPASMAADFASGLVFARADENARSFAHPFWWAAFTLTGV